MWNNMQGRKKWVKHSLWYQNALWILQSDTYKGCWKVICPKSLPQKYSFDYWNTDFEKWVRLRIFQYPTQGWLLIWNFHSMIFSLSQLWKSTSELTTFTNWGLFGWEGGKRVWCMKQEESWMAARLWSVGDGEGLRSLSGKNIWCMKQERGLEGCPVLKQERGLESSPALKWERGFNIWFWIKK